MLDRTFGGFAARTLERDGWSPLADIEEQDDAYVVKVELPGVKREDISIELVGNELTIAGELKDPDKVDAKLQDGVLAVHAPKSERAQRRQITVKSS